MLKRTQAIILLIWIISLTSCKTNMISELKIMAGTDFETSAFYLKPSNEEESIRFAVVGGIHGNETAGFKAAESLMNEIQNLYPNAEVLFIPNANKLAINQDKRYVEGAEDLNRMFDYISIDNETAKLAKEIKTLILDFEPLFIIDHHESLDNYLNTDGKYKLGNTVIVSDVGSNVIDLLFILDEINSKIVDDIPFILEGNPPEGSFNRVISNELGRFVATIETNRNLDLDQRIEQQKIVAHEIIKYFMKEN